MNPFSLIGREIFVGFGAGLVVLIASILLGYIVIGKFLHPDIRIRWVILILTAIFLCWLSASPSWLAGLSTKDYQHLRFELIVRMIPIGISIGQMFGGSKVKLPKRKKGEKDKEEEESS